MKHTGLRSNVIYEKELSDQIIGCAIEVHKELGPGYLEKVYERAFLVELNHSKLRCETQVPIQIHYKGVVVGDYIADMIIEDKVIVELKSCSKIMPVFEAQLINYLVATKKKVGYIINFSGAVLEFVRKVC